MNALGVMQMLAASLAAIQIADGYSCAAGAQVHQLRDAFSDADVLPLVGVIFEGEQASGNGALVTCRNVPMSGDFLIVGAIQLPEDNLPDTPLNLISDIKRAIFAATRIAAYSQAALTVYPGSALVMPHVDGDAHTEVQVRVRASWTEVLTT